MDLASVGDHLAGKTFSNSLRLKISGVETSVPYRMELIEQLVNKLDIIHFGCADHIEVIEYKIERNLWFHKRLMSSARTCTGIDNDPRAVEFLRTKLKIPGVYLVDIEEQEIPDEIRSGHYEYLILGEIIEHIDNPVRFLQTIHNKFDGIVNKIIITAPNAFSWNNFKHVFKHVEVINSDHRFWFTPYTLSKVLYRAGFREMNFQMVENYRRDKTSWLKDYIFRRFPSFRDTVLIRAVF
jgi:hypothetical protein